jgi:hypothetical protein
MLTFKESHMLMAIFEWSLPSQYSEPQASDWPFAFHLVDNSGSVPQDLVHGYMNLGFDSSIELNFGRAYAPSRASLTSGSNCLWICDYAELQ